MTAAKPTATGSSEPPIVTIVDDDASVRDALSSLFRSAGWEVRTFASGWKFLACPRILAPGCLIADVTLPDIGGLELQQRIASRPELPLIFLTRESDVFTTVRAMKAGAFEFLTKPVDNDELLSAVHAAIEHSSAMLGRAAAHQALSDRHSALTRREREVMALVVAGYLNKQVGAELDISEITVKAHRGRVMRKMQARSFAQLISMAAELRLTVAPQVRVGVRAQYAKFSNAFGSAGRLTALGAVQA